MGLRRWVKLSFYIEKNFEDLIIWKLNELRIFSYAFKYLENGSNSSKVEIWLPESKCNFKFKDRLENIIKNFLEANMHKTPSFSWTNLNEDWLDSWKKFWKPQQIGNDFLVLPSWMDLPKELESKKIIKLDLDLAFGTGSHPSTYLCLKEMENISILNKKVLDIGCGSGILTIAAKLLGSNNLHALDNSNLAIKSARENMKLNFSDLLDLHLYECSFQEFILNKSIKNFDLIMCNILSEVIKIIIPSISNLLNRNGKLILSGILNSQQIEIIKILNLNNLVIDNVISENDWVCIKSTKN